MKRYYIFLLLVALFVASCILSQPIHSPDISTSALSTNSKTPSEQLELALSQVQRVKMRFNAQVTSEGQSNEVLSGIAQFESRGDSAKPLSYINISFNSFNQITIFLSENKAAIREGTDEWQGIPLADSFTATITRYLKVSPDITAEDLFASTGLRLTSNNLNNSWQSFGTAELDGQHVYSFQRESKNVIVWNRILEVVSPRLLVVERTLTELWVAVTNNLPYRVRYTLYMKNAQSDYDDTLEINLYPYDYNEPLSLPIDLPK